MLPLDLIDSLFPSGLPDPAHWERRYPPRELPIGAEVTRFAPSPTGFLHIGSVYTATIDLDIARHTNGVYLIRIEDTDQSRFEEDAASQFEAGFAHFGITPDEDGRQGAYGPYTQSQRGQVYLTFVRELLRQGKAYPCFETPERGKARAARQKAVGALPGYYGEWAIWRDAPADQVEQRLAAGDPYVIRFRSPGIGGHRVSFTDEIRGEITQDDNRNDAVILKSGSGDAGGQGARGAGASPVGSPSPRAQRSQELRLPTYHFAHAVDDHLMRVTLVIRGDEWVSSVPLHNQLFDALGFPRVRYAHLAPLMKQDGGSRRKLSKRKDPEMNVAYYMELGFPQEAVLYYLRGLANGRLAEMPLREALQAPIRLAECGVAGPLLDMVKLDDISADFVATLPGAQILDRVVPWAEGFDPELAGVLRAERDLALRALTIEREGTDNPRKDLRKWADFRPVYGYFFPEIFQLVTDPADARFGGLDETLVREMASGFAAGYQPPAPGSVWFDQVRELAAGLGFAPSQKEYKKNPDAYPGSIAEASAVIRVLITGTRRSPDLAQIAAALGPGEVLRRVRALA